MGKVGKGGRGRDEGYGKWVELADLPTLQINVPLLVCIEMTDRRSEWPRFVYERRQKLRFARDQKCHMMK